MRLAVVLGVRPGWLAFGTSDDDECRYDRELSTLAIRLRTIRLAQGLSLRLLGARSGTSGNLVSQIEKGSDPAIDTLERIATALAVPVAWLGFGWTLGGEIPSVRRAAFVRG